MKLPPLFREIHQDRLFKLFQEYGEIVRIVPDEPLGPVTMSKDLPITTVTVVTVRCINDNGALRFEAASPDDLKTASDWARRHRNTTREQFDWLPFAR